MRDTEIYPGFLLYFSTEIIEEMGTARRENGRSKAKYNFFNPVLEYKLHLRVWEIVPQKQRSRTFVVSHQLVHWEVHWEGKNLKAEVLNIRHFCFLTRARGHASEMSGRDTGNMYKGSRGVWAKRQNVQLQRQVLVPLVWKVQAIF